MKRQAGREVSRLLAWVCLEGDEKQVVGVDMLKGRPKGRQAGRFAGCWRGYAWRAMKRQAGREVCRCWRGYA